MEWFSSHASILLIDTSLKKLQINKKIMPFSLPQFDDQIEKLLRNKNFENFLDIGAGEGKYGKMIKAINPQAKVTAVEVDKSYIVKYKLKNLYDEVLNIDIDSFIDNNPAYNCDAVVIGDCIEHLRKSSGIDLLNYLVYRTQQIIIKFPVELIQYDWHGHASEAHRSIWDKHDFEGFNFKFYKKDMMRLVVIKGYRSPRKITS